LLRAGEGKQNKRQFPGLDIEDLLLDCITRAIFRLAAAIVANFDMFPGLEAGLRNAGQQPNIPAIREMRIGNIGIYEAVLREGDVQGALAGYDEAIQIEIADVAIAKVWAMVRQHEKGSRVVIEEKYISDDEQKREKCPKDLVCLDQECEGNDIGRCKKVNHFFIILTDCSHTCCYRANGSVVLAKKSTSLLSTRYR